MQCFEKAAKEVQEMMISSCAAYDNIYIVQVYGLLREAHIKVIKPTIILMYFLIFIVQC